MSRLRRAASRLVRAMLRFAYPQYESVQAQLATLSGAVAHLEARLGKDERRHEKQLTTISRALEKKPSGEDLAAVRTDMARLTSAVDRQLKATRKALRRGEARSEDSREERRVLERLERIAAEGRPIVVGPWCGEVGFELLYWIPFVNWFRQRYDVDPNRLVVVSRGGVFAWYSHIGGRYVEALDHVSVDEFRQATEAAKKQRAVTAFDVRLLRRVARSERLGRARLLHPEAMYRAFWQFWKGNASARRVAQYAAFAPLRAHDGAELPAGLPADFVAVRFYFSDCFPDTPANRTFVSGVIDSLASSTNVVLLNTPFTIDDHVDFAGARGPRVFAIDRMPPARNLAIQTAVLRRARAFVGTYGGYAYLAPLCGVPSLAFHSHRTFAQHHLDMAQQMLAGLGAPSLIALDARDADLLRIALQRVTEPATGAGA